MTTLFLNELISANVVSGPSRLPWSPQRQADGQYVFQVDAPSAKEIAIDGQWSGENVPMTKNAENRWTTAPQKIPAGIWEYSLVIDGIKVVDPNNPELKQERKPRCNILHVPGTPPKVWDWQEVPPGTVHQHTYVSPQLGRARELTVYTPPGYEKSGDTTYPLLVLQHGSGDTNRTWIDHGKAHWIIDNLLAQKKAQPLIVVMLDGQPLGEINWEDKTELEKAFAAFDTDLMENALPEIEKLYRVKTGAEHRAIAGLSLGGAQALGLGFKYTDHFSVIGAFSPAIPPATFYAKAISQPEKTNRELKRVWIAIGDKDFLLDQNHAFIKLLKEKGLQHEYHEHPGDHSWPIWRQHLADFVPRLFQ